MNRLFLLHHTDEGRIGLCAEDDPRPPPEDRVISRLPWDHVMGLADDIWETLEDCLRRDGWEQDDD